MEEDEQTQFIPKRGTLFTKEGKSYIDLKNPHFTKEDLQDVLKEIRETDNRKKINQIENSTVYQEQIPSFIENPKRKVFRTKNVGVLNFPILDCLYCAIDTDYIKIFDTGVTERVHFGFVRNKFCASTIFYGKLVVGFPRKDRTFVSCNSLIYDNSLNGEKYVLLVHSVDVNDLKFSNVEKCTDRGYYVFEKINENQTRYFYTVAIDMHGWVN